MIEAERKNGFLKRSLSNLRSHLSNKTTLAISLLSIGLLLALGMIAYQNFLLGRTKEKKDMSKGATPQNTRNNTYKGVFSVFLSSLQKGNGSAKNSHEELFEYLKSLDRKSFPSSQELKQFADTNNIPYDYAFFFKECLPAYSSSFKESAGIKDDNIILSLPKSSEYKTSLFVNYSNYPAENLSQTVDSQGSSNRLIISGTYSSPFNMPVGLTIKEGKVVNPVIQKFDGLLIIGPDGKIHLTHIDELRYNLKNLHIKTSFPDYMEFIDVATKDKLTVLQSHLIINNGMILFEDNPGQKKLRKRILFQTEDDGIHIYDSLGKEQSLFEAAKFVKDKYKAFRAVNLETGTYNYCTLYKNNKLINLSEFKNGVVISNLIVIDF